MGRLRILFPVVLGLALAPGLPARAKPRFTSSDIVGQGAEMICCDLDGDGLKALVLVAGTNLSIFYQEPGKGFARTPQAEFRLEAKLCAIWPARLGRIAESLLVMTSEGVTELGFTNRTGPPVRQEIIH